MNVIIVNFPKKTLDEQKELNCHYHLHLASQVVHHSTEETMIELMFNLLHKVYRNQPF